MKILKNSERPYEFFEKLPKGVKIYQRGEDAVFKIKIKKHGNN